MKRSRIPSDFQMESERIRSIVRERPSINWEYLLASELLTSRLEPIQKQYSDLQNFVGGRTGKRLSDTAFTSWCRSLFDRVWFYMEKLGNQFTVDLQKAMGPPGKPGDPTKIKRAVDAITDTCNQLFGIEKEIRSVKAPPRFEPLRARLEGISTSYIEESIRFKTALMEVALDFKRPNPRGKYSLDFTHHPISQDVQIRDEIQRLKNTQNIILTPSEPKSFSEIRRELFGEPPPKPISPRKSTRSQRANIRSTVSIINKLFRLFG